MRPGLRTYRNICSWFDQMEHLCKSCKRHLDMIGPGAIICQVTSVTLRFCTSITAFCCQSGARCTLALKCVFGQHNREDVWWHIPCFFSFDLLTSMLHFPSVPLLTVSQIHLEFFLFDLEYLFTPLHCLFLVTFLMLNLSSPLSFQSFPLPYT